ncbi:MAG: hypothetical protein COV07_04605 [Candidatus Vogelbacteria bacterium CG10_big_fil_rev_8_21_14_0_10_45_14]|uniref:Thioredoxin-like fold domain-containing protein n=1 Tax=Candidatus Vogelbacteria bacterium CG10_big_fil_rev_8_21_14_0_10_45_14 TaxID=1975042 RepID=A0A2H0RI98_9BACT|nr:MAG: hypothetical protein COV07_04605 [Candidatus Vogelbacteria bacterium CG10_big_fil_rev_8_21_14_0_10_45_14]
MFCIASLIVLAILSIFSASHRPLAKLALDCVLKRVTFQPCNSDFKEQMQGRIVGALLRKAPPVARFVHKRFEFLAWVFVVLSVASLVWALWGGYNFYAWGSCNGRNVEGFCAFDPTGSNNAITSTTEECREEAPTDADLRHEKLTTSLYPTLNKEGKKEFLVIGDFGCDYTRAAWPTFKEIREKVKEARFVFVQFPVKEETEYLSDYATCASTIDEEKYFNLADRFFAEDKEFLWDEANARDIIKDVGYDLDAIDACLADPKTEDATRARKLEVRNSGLYGTPTVFAKSENDKSPVPLVGPKPLRVYRRILRGSIF